MFSSAKNILIIILTLLQLIAPLVHAHTGEEHSPPNIHLPGFESFSLTIDTPALQANTHLNIETCSIISIGSAIEHKKVYTDHTTCYSLPTDNFPIISITHRVSFNYTPRQQIHIPATHYYLLPVRAPPANS